MKWKATAIGLFLVSAIFLSSCELVDEADEKKAEYEAQIKGLERNLRAEEKTRRDAERQVEKLEAELRKAGAEIARLEAKKDSEERMAIAIAELKEELKSEFAAIIKAEKTNVLKAKAEGRTMERERLKKRKRPEAK